MPSPIVIATAVESFLGALLTSGILYLVLSRGRQLYHYLFAAFLFICLFWDTGTFLLMIRNRHLEELPAIGYVISLPCTLLPSIVFHFACVYTKRLIKWAIVLGWVTTLAFFVLQAAGLYGRIEDIYTYEWGNVFRIPADGVLGILSTVVWFSFCLPACWLLHQFAAKATDPLQKRHAQYITAGLLVITFAIVKIGVVLGLNVPILLPLGMLLVDAFNAIIGIAIIKDRLFDITLIVGRGTLYSVLAALLIFIYSLTEHLMITYFGDLIGAHSAVANILAIAIGIAILMPVKQRLEHLITEYFGRRKLVF
jgi:hypothetical protein